MEGILSSRADQTKGVPFDFIFEEVRQKWPSTFTKEFVFKVIDELFQYGKLYEESKQVYKYLA